MSSSLLEKFEKYCKSNNIKITDQRRIVIQVIDESTDHPDVDQLFIRAKVIDSKVSIATVYRTVKLLEEAKILEKHDFGDGKARYEFDDNHHDHIINIETGEITEFVNDELEKMKSKIAEDLGFKLVDHKLALYVVPKEK